MALTNDQVTALNFKDFYNQIRPYLNGDAHDAFIPIGSIISIMGNEAPLNFLICDGSTYNIADYTQLASYFTAQFGSANYFGGDGTTTFAVPDLQGEFLRGSGTNSHTNQGSGGDVGEHQDGTIVTPYTEKTGSVVSSYLENRTLNEDATIYTTLPRKAIPADAEYANGLGITSRPTNTSVLYCIAYKNVYADMSGLAEAGDGININNGVISTDNMPAEDMSEVASPMPSVMSRRFKYSTEEQVVGEWIDGKPVYQKIYEVDVNSNEDGVTVDIPPVDTLVECKMSYKDPRPSMGSVNYYWSNTDAIRIFFENGKINWIAGGTYPYKPIHVVAIIRYTKTTD